MPSSTRKGILLDSGVKFTSSLSILFHQRSPKRASTGEERSKVDGELRATFVSLGQFSEMDIEVISVLERLGL